MTITTLLTPVKKIITKQFKRLRSFLKRHYRVKKNRRKTAYVIVAVILFSLFFGLIGVSSENQELQSSLSARKAKLYQLQTDLQTTKNQKAQTEQQVKERDQKLQDTQKQIDELNQQLQAKKEQESLLARATAVVAPVSVSAASTTTPLPSSDAKSFIYMHESGNNPDATNSQGCYGLGQDCNGIVRSRCGADYACQDEYFTSYCMSRYGSWENAMAVWQSKGWW